MTIVDQEVKGAPGNLSMTGFTVSLTGMMQLTFAGGTYTDGEYSYQIEEDTVLDIVADTTYKTEVIIRLIYNPSTEDVALWKDSILLDNVSEGENAPAGYAIIDRICSFILGIGQTDLSAETINILKVI